MFDQCIYFNLSTLSRQITKIWNEEFAKVGLSPSHGYLLSALTANPDASQKELSEIMELDASTITRFIDALTTKKLIEKTSKGKGARYILTTKGNTISSEVSTLMGELFTKMEATFDKNEFQKIVTGLQDAKNTLKETYA